MSIAVSGESVPSHFQHRIEILVPSTSATWRLCLNDGIVVVLDQVLELMIQENQRMLVQRFAQSVSHFAIFRRDEVGHCSSGS